MKTGSSSIRLLILFTIFSNSLIAQRILTLDEAIKEALEKNSQITLSKLNAEKQTKLIGTAWDIPKTTINLMYGQFNTYGKDNNITISQTMSLPSVYLKQKKYLHSQANLANQQIEITKNEIRYQVKQLYYQLEYHQNRAKLLIKKDSLYQKLAKTGEIRFKTGETNILDQSTAQMQLFDSKNELQENYADLKIVESQLQTLLQSKEPITIPETDFAKAKYADFKDTSLLNNNPQKDYYFKEYLSNELFTKTEKQKLLPDFLVGYFNQSNAGFENITGEELYFSPSYRFQGVIVGLAIPIWQKTINARIKTAKINEKIANQNSEYFEQVLKNEFKIAVLNCKKWDTRLDYYEKIVLKQSELVFKNAQISIKNGEIDFLTYSHALTNILEVQNNHLDQLLNYDLAIAKLEYLIGE